MGVRVTDIAYVRFEAPDLDLMEGFLLDFGLRRSERTNDTLYMRGTDDEGFVHVTTMGAEARFIGLAFEAATTADLETLAGRPEFSEIEDLAGPGGGAVTAATDPDGFRVEVVAGRRPVDTLPVDRRLVHNDGEAQPRKGSPLRLDSGPSQVKRLGHCVLNVTSFADSEAWYKQRFGLITSDEIAIDEDRSLGAFLRCDRGEVFVDHHTLFLVGSKAAGFNHAAFEVANVDDLMAGHTHLSNEGRTHHWGIGRHLLGSQVYDYWADPWGQVVEHWTDGDLFNRDTPPGRAGIPELMASQWGPTHSTP